MHSSIGHGDGAYGGLGYPSSDRRQVHRPTSRLPGWNASMDLRRGSFRCRAEKPPELAVPFIPCSPASILMIENFATSHLATISSFIHNHITGRPTSKAGAATAIHLKSSALFALDRWFDDVTWAVGHDFIIHNVVILISAKRQPQRDDERCHLQMMMGILDLLLRRAPASFPATRAFLPIRNLGNHQTKHPTIICRAPMPHWCRFGLIFPTRSAVLGRISDARAQSALRKCEAFTTCQSSIIGKRLAERDENLLTNPPVFVIYVLFGHRH